LAVEARIASLSAIIEFVRNGALEADLPEARIGELDLAVEEIFMNVCCHAYPDGVTGVVTVGYEVPVRGELSVEVADQGAEFNPLTIAAPDLTLNVQRRPVGGLGILLVKTLATSLHYRREHDWNRLTFSISANS
jgi:anti-sigma regulatory factor (Ser/Thr protein kinase)